MNIKRIINKNGKLIWYTLLIIAFGFFIIRNLNSYYEEQEEKRKIQVNQSNQISNVSENEEQTTSNEKKTITYSTESKTSVKAIKSFIHYCNNKELENAYKMLTTECKNAMFPTLDEFKKIYINNIFNITRTAEIEKWSTDGNKNTYLISLYGSILETGKKDNFTQDYYTLIKNDEGVYRLNINCFIYGEKRNLETIVNGLTVKIDNVDIYDEYEKATITITNKTSKQVCLTGDNTRDTIYIKDSKGFTYLSLNSLFDGEELVLEPNSTETYIVEFNKLYDSTNKANQLVISDVIFDYEQYLNSDNKENYSNRTSIKVNY